MSNKFEEQLKNLLNDDDIEKAVSELPDDGEEGEYEQGVEEMLPVQYEEKESNVQTVDETGDFVDDYKFARSNYYGLIGRSNAAIDLILKIAQMSEHPRAVEVAANLMKTSADITKELMALQKVMDEKEKKSSSGEKPNGNYKQVNNYYYTDKEKAESLIDGLPDDEDDKDVK